jgi:YidC/Oxa1 family membrane protein insertase
MERNHIIGIILIFATMMVWNITTAPSTEELEKRRITQDSIAALTAPVTAKSPAAETVLTQDSSMMMPAKDTLQIQNINAMFGTFGGASTGKEKVEVLENELIKLTFSSKGGKIKEALLKKHVKTVVGKDDKSSTQPVKLLTSPDNVFEYTLPVASSINKFVKSSSLYFTSQKTGNSIIFIAKTASGGSFVQKYELSPDNYTVNYSVETTGLETDMAGAKSLALTWNNNIAKIERGVQFEQNYSSAYFKEKDQKVDYCNCVSDDAKELNEKPIEWISHTNQFFNTSLIAVSQPFASAKLATKLVDSKNTDYVKHIDSEIVLPWTDFKSGKYNMKFYIGPNEFKRLEAVATDLDEVIPFGSSIFGTINRWAIRPFFDFLSGLFTSKGIVILILIFLIKMLLYPLMYKTLLSQAKMSALKPEIDTIKAKTKDDTQKQQVETMKLYREFGVSPLGGCLPMLLQAPIWYALFRFFPASITFRQEPFLWANDLSSYDVLFKLGTEIPYFGSHVSLFTLLWAVSTIIYTYYSMQNVDMSANPAMKYVQYIMPVMFLAFFNNYASGLTCYMFFSNMINIIQTIVTKKYIFDEKKIRAELIVEKSKPKKKGGFQERLEAAVKQQQDLKETKKDSKKGK